MTAIKITFNQAPGGFTPRHANPAPFMCRVSNLATMVAKGYRVVAVEPMLTRFRDGAPGAADVPANNETLPATNGRWLNPATGQEWPSTVNVTYINPATGRKYQADSDWEPAIGSDLYQLTQGSVIRYRRGYPDFSNYAEFTATLDPMKGNNTSDFTLSSTQFRDSAQFAPFLAQGMTVKQWMDASTNYTTPRTIIVPTVGGKNWVWHHKEDMLHMELVPSVLNTARYGGVVHAGGASLADVARW